ncbi:anti-sigma factor [Methyloceanibacter sp.]|uniref:anti-sigma factor family protein n=1 Tax=Methyloceanibacter sp. TaxID=1965321 RepID=UPI002D23667C|nr:anti-sigma factor [Methyloceanibacter sp.]HZP09591.1 anti-sigma factor [Methyloceanibacter sp.]
MTLSREDEVLLNAYLDGELSPLEADRFEQRLASEPALAAEIEAYRLLGAALRADMGEDVPPRDLRDRIESRLGIGHARSGEGRAWGSLAASFLAGAVLAGTLTFGAFNQQSGDQLASEVVSAHIRGLMAPAPMDVASSDHHTVKPWFNGKLGFAPVVPDLGAEGYPLLGGRIDVIGLEPAASLIYSRGKHLITVTELPEERALPASSNQSERGYLVLSWSEGGVSYCAVSDAAPDELASFVKLFRAAAGAAAGRPPA